MLDPTIVATSTHTPAPVLRKGPTPLRITPPSQGKGLIPDIRESYPPKNRVPHLHDGFIVVKVGGHNTTCPIHHAPQTECNPHSHP